MSDADLTTAELLGVRIGMTPRRLQNEITPLGLRESGFNRQTLQDIVTKYDRGASEHTEQIILSKGDSTLSYLDDVTLTVQFCYGQAMSVSINEYIAKKDFEKRKAQDLRMFPKVVEGPKANERVMYTARYKPDEFSSAYVAYVDRGYRDFDTREPVIERIVSVLEGVSCYYRSLRRELRY